MIARLRGDHQELWPRSRYTPVRPFDDGLALPVGVDFHDDEPLVGEDPDLEPAPVPPACERGGWRGCWSSPGSRCDSPVH